jgi:transcriptional antiterminator RfaH
MQRWYLIHTKPSAETVAQSNLDRQGYEVYLPRIVLAARRNGQWQDRIGALFPRYLFLHLNEGWQALSPVHSTKGVASVVRFGSRYTIVPDAVIQDLRAREDAVTGLHRLNRGSRMSPGAKVKVGMGPFDGLEGVFRREAGEDRVVVLLQVLGHDVSVCIPVDSILLSRAV